jgi:hypothetical protein
VSFAYINSKETANEWIRANYYVSDIPTPDRKQTVQQTLGAPYAFLGNLILSKIPFEQVYCWQFSKESKPLNRGNPKLFHFEKLNHVISLL